MILDSNDVTVNNIATRGNAWGGVSVQTKNGPTDNVTFSGSFDVEEDNPLLLEKDPPGYYDITNVEIPPQFEYVVYAFREGDNYQQAFYQETLDGAKAFAQSLMDSEAFTYSNMTIYDVAEENYYVIEGMKVQDAIDAASDGDTINVAAGTYTEAILIDKPLILRGATADVNKNGYTVPADYAWDDTVESIINHPNPSGGYVAIVDIVDIDDVTFEGFVVQELNAVGNLNSSLVRVKADIQEISDIVVRNNVIGPNTNVISQDGTHGRMGLYIVNHPYDDLGVIDSTFSGNKIFDCQGNGNNVFIWSSYFDYGAPGPASMSGTVIEDNEIYGAHRSGIETAGGFSGLTIRNNSIYGNGGSTIEGKPELMFGNGILMIRGSGDRENIEGYGPVNVTVEGNEIYNNEGHGIYMGPNNEGITITRNILYNNDEDAIVVDLIGNYWNPDFEPETGPHTNLGGSQNIAAHLNNIHDNGAGVRVVGTPTNDFVLDATNNWWDDASGPTHATNTGGTGDTVSNNVAYSSWLGATIDTTQMTFIVDDVGPEPAAGYIQTAIGAASDDDTVNVAAGTYVESLVIDKPLTLQGPNAGISPNPPGLRVAEAVITGESPLIRLPTGADVNPLTIEGFTFQDATHPGGSRGGVIFANGESDGWGNVTIRSNRFMNNYGPAIGVWTSDSIEPLFPADWTITDNLIDGVTGTDRSGIYLDLANPEDVATKFSGWEISNNTIKHTQYGGIMVHGAIDMVISGNIIEDVQKTGIQSSGVYGNLTITDNVITRAMLASESGPIRAGIRLYGTNLDDEYGPSQLIGPVWVTNNIVTDSYIGFAIKDGHDIAGKEVHVNYNSFTGNAEAGLRHGGTGLLDATNNWWGHASGPGGVGAGAGDTISENVDAGPWHLKQITALPVSNLTESSVDLSWTTAGAWDGDHFDVRYSKLAITPENWKSAKRVTGEPTPAPTVQGMRVHGLSENTEYHFGLKLIDKGIGSSDISNIVSATTLTTADAPTDTTPPSEITDLKAATGTPPTKKVILTWTAKGDDGIAGIASKYIIKRSTSPITTDADFDSATTVHNNLRCKSNGEIESFTVKRLSANTIYYFAIKIQDEVPNTSIISNMVDITTANLLPTVTNISPPNADNGEPSPLTITGTNFISSGTTVVRLISDDNTFHLPNVTYVSETELTAVVPIGAPTGTYKARVINNNGRSAPSATYIVTAASKPLPVVINLIPQMAASDTEVNGVKIFGKNLTGATEVFFGDTEAKIIAVSDTKITVKVEVPGLSAGEYDVKVTTPDGTNSISAVKFKVSAPVVVNTDTTEDTTTSEVIDLGDTNETPVQITLTTDTSETATQDTDTDAEIEVVIPPKTKLRDSKNNDYTGNIHPPRVVKPDESELTDLADNAVVIEMGNPEETIHFDQDFVATIIITADTEPVIWYYNKDTEAYELAGKTGTKDGVDYVPGGTKLGQEDSTYTMGLLLDHMSSYVAGVEPVITIVPATVTADVAFTISGTNFHPTGANVYLNGTAGTIISRTSTTQIVARFATAGSYTLKVENPDELSDTTSIEITSPPPSPPAVGGGGGNGYEPPAPPPGTTDVRGEVTSAGRFTRSVSATSEDELCTLTIPTGTIGLTEELERLIEITILEMDEPPPPPEDAHIIGLAYDFCPDGATFDPAITLTWSYDPADIPEGVAEYDLVIAYYDEETGEWVELEGCVVDPVTKTVTAPVSHFTTFAIVVSIPPPAPAAFSVTNLLVIKSLEIQPKEAVAIAVSVANIGGTEGRYTVVLKINGVKEADKRVTIAAGRSQSVSFSVSREDAGTYKIAVDGLSASFTVVGPAPVVAPAPPPPAPPAPPPLSPAPPAPAPPEVIPPTAPNWPVIGGIIAATVILALLIFFLIRRRAY
ncbi:hypothetical protein ES703_21746 [subsurface metagenome]